MPQQLEVIEHQIRVTEMKHALTTFWIEVLLRSRHNLANGISGPLFTDEEIKNRATRILAKVDTSSN